MSCVLLASRLAHSLPPGDSQDVANAASSEVQAARPATLEEARSRARLLHETMHATLHIVHLRYYREDEALPLPAHTLKTVFRELDSRQNVKFHWLVVEGQAMNKDHKPRDEFEKNAAKALAEGKDEFELVENGVYRRAGPITLSGECLKCHVPDRTSLEDRSAGLVIRMPIEEN
jgi:hypothetical protein